MRRVNLTNLDNIKLDIGCGDFKKQEFVGMDRLDFGQEILWDINHGIPLPDNSVLEVYSSHFIEHLKIDELHNFFYELIRVVKNGTEVLMICPHADTIEAHYVCHFISWNENKIKGICQEIHQLQLLETTRDGINLIIKLKINK